MLKCLVVHKRHGTAVWSQMRSMISVYRPSSGYICDKVATVGFAAKLGLSEGVLALLLGVACSLDLTVGGEIMSLDPS